MENRRLSSIQTVELHKRTPEAKLLSQTPKVELHSRTSEDDLQKVELHNTTSKTDFQKTELHSRFTDGQAPQPNTRRSSSITELSRPISKSPNSMADADLHKAELYARSPRTSSTAKLLRPSSKDGQAPSTNSLRPLYRWSILIANTRRRSTESELHSQTPKADYQKAKLHDRLPKTIFQKVELCGRYLVKDICVIYRFNNVVSGR